MKDRIDKGETYKCEVCGETFTATTEHAECVAEAEIISDMEFDAETFSVVCDDCWRKVMGLPPSEEKS